MPMDIAINATNSYAYIYDDGMCEFNCEVIACGIAGRLEGQLLIRDIKNNELGWCSAHLVVDYDG